MTKKDKKVFILTLKIIAVIFIATGVLMMLNKNEKTSSTKSFVSDVRTYPTAVPTAVPSRDKLTQYYRDEFYSTCNADGTNRAYCDCTLDYLTDALGPNGVYSMSIEYLETRKMPQVMVDAVDNCMQYATF